MKPMLLVFVVVVSTSHSPMLMPKLMMDTQGFIKFPDGTVYDLTGKDLNIDQMCLLCKVFSAKGVGSMNKFDCHKALAMRKSLGHQYGVGKIVDLKDNDA